MTVIVLFLGMLIVNALWPGYMQELITWYYALILYIYAAIFDYFYIAALSKTLPRRKSEQSESPPVSADA